MGTVTSFTIDEQLKPAGKIAGLYAELSEKFWELPHLSPESIELCRLALAVMHKAEAEQAERHPAGTGIPQVKIDAVLNESWRKEPTFSVVERALLDFTEYYSMDPQSIPDEVATKVVDLTGENGLVCLVESLGFIDSRIRLALIYSSLTT